MADHLEYSVAAAASAVSLSDKEIRREIERGRIKPHYAGTKVLISREELDRWRKGLPTEPERRP